jgi:ADP-ribosylglycohydrolase
MAFCLSAVLRNGFELTEAAKAYSRWLTDAVEPPAAVRVALELWREGRPVEAVGRRAWMESGQRLKDNGGLARTAPIGVYFARHRDERIRLSLEDTGLTHFAPLCRLASVIVNAAVAAGLTSPKERAETTEVLKAIEAELGVAAAGLAQREPEWVGQVKDAFEQLREDVSLAQQDDPLLYGPELHLFTTPTPVRVTVRLALWELFHAPSVEAALIDVVNRGGDAPVNALVTGAVLGAIHGEGGIPGRWREVLLESPGPSGGSHWHAYHPRLLVTLTPKP